MAQFGFSLVALPAKREVEEFVPRGGHAATVRSETIPGREEEMQLKNLNGPYPFRINMQGTEVNTRVSGVPKNTEMAWMQQCGAAGAAALELIASTADAHAEVIRDLLEAARADGIPPQEACCEAILDGDAFAGLIDVDVLSSAIQARIDADCIYIVQKNGTPSWTIILKGVEPTLCFGLTAAVTTAAFRSAATTQTWVHDGGEYTYSIQFRGGMAGEAEPIANVAGHVAIDVDNFEQPENYADMFGDTGMFDDV